MNEKLKEFQKQLRNMTDQEKIVQAEKMFDMLESIPKIEYEESMKALARIRGKDENHYLDEVEPKVIKQLERYIIKDIDTNKYYREENIWKENSFYLTTDICSAKQFLVKEDTEEIISDYDHRNLKVVKIRVSYEEVEE